VVTVEGKSIAEIDRGVVILVGVGPEDSEEQAAYIAEKIVNLRIFEDQDGKMNLSLLDVGGEAIVVSQFTLYADTRKGRRPSFVNAAPPETAEPLVERFAALLADQGIPTQTGQFGAKMVVKIINDGPVTILIERE
jgi:D-tyrosyl-tRNA(Tyr) deacylase